MNKMSHNENNLVFPFTAPLSLPIYCLILPSSSLCSHSTRLHAPAPALICFGRQLIPKKGEGSDAYKQILRVMEETEREKV